MGVLADKIWDYWEKQRREKRPSMQSLQEAIRFYVEVMQQDVAGQFSACWMLAQFLDHLKPGWVAQSPSATASSATNVAQVPWASMQLVELAEKIRQQHFGQHTPPFQSKQDADHYMTGVSATDPFRTTSKDMASHFDVAESAVTMHLCTGQPCYISAVYLTNITSTITMPNGTVEPRSKVHVSFNDPNFRAWKPLPQHIRQAFRPPRGKEPTPTQAEVYWFVRQLGGPPGVKGKDKMWWENIAAPQWNKTYPERPMQADSLRREYATTRRVLAQETIPRQAQL